MSSKGSSAGELGGIVLAVGMLGLLGLALGFALVGLALAAPFILTAIIWNWDVLSGKIAIQAGAIYTIWIAIALFLISHRPPDNTVIIYTVIGIGGILAALTIYLFRHPGIQLYMQEQREGRPILSRLHPSAIPARVDADLGEDEGVFSYAIMKRAIVEEYEESHIEFEVPAFPNLDIRYEPRKYAEYQLMMNAVRNVERDDEERYAIIFEAVGNATSVFAHRMPPGPGPWPVQAHLADRMPDLVNTMQEMKRPFYTEPILHRELFVSLRGRLDTLTELRNQNPDWLDCTPKEQVDAVVGSTFLSELLDRESAFSFDDSRFKHQWIVSPPGGGKTTLLESMVIADLLKVIEGKASVIVMDSQNTIIPRIKMLKFFAKGHALEDKLVLLEPENPLALNVFDMGDTSRYTRRERQIRQASATKLVRFCLSTVSDQQGDMLLYLIQFCLAMPGATLHDLRRLLMPNGLNDYRQHLPLVDETVQDYLTGVFNETGSRVTKDALLRRVMGMLANPTFRQVFSAKQNRFNMTEELAQGKVILINTDKELMSDDGCQVFGRFFIAQLMRAVETRGEGLPVYFYIDEMADYLGEGVDDEILASILDTGRKRNVGLILAHQRLAQIKSANVLDAMSNVDIKFAGGNDTDAKTLASLMHTDPEKIHSRKVGHFMAYVKGMTPSAVEVSVERVIPSLSRMTSEQFAEIQESMIDRYCEPPHGSTPSPTEAPEPEQEPATAPAPRRQRPSVVKAEPSPYGDVV